MRYRMNGVCSSELELEIENDIITNIAVYGGCNGNLQGIAALTIGQDAREVAKKLSGIRCGMKKTSCPDQIARAIMQYYQEQ